MSSPSDRDQLCGALAAHLGLVSRGQLLEAARDAACGPTPLPGRLRLAPEDEEVLRRLADRLAAHSGGRLPAGLAALVAEVGSASAGSTTGPAGGEASLPETTAPEATAAPGGPPAAGGGRFLRLRFHARGGMGEVSVALDAELAREVALKEIQEQHADRPASRARFVREAEITGQLEHPGVVPVYGLGVYPDGRPYYAMRLIKGESLHAAITGWHASGGAGALELRRLVGRFVAACNAVAYAHSKGIVHRDLKPANIMVGEFGETLVVDWGLARRAGAAGEAPGGGHAEPAGAEEARTEAGQVVGTPGYMPPEQARGQAEAVGPASDIFALGATLYHLLVGNPPYRGPGALAQAARGEPPAVRRGVPQALAAVCAKAMAARPEGRYGSVGALVGDVEHWLADEPVGAYREPLAERARRWARRHRTAVSTLGVLLLASVVGLGGGLYAVGREQRRTADQRDEAQGNLARALGAEESTKRALDRALTAESRAVDRLAQSEANLRLAKKAVDDCFGIAKESPLLEGEAMSDVRKLLYTQARPFYEKFRALRPGDRGITEETADQLFRLAYIDVQIDRRGEALRAYQQARQSYARLAADHPAVPAYTRELGKAHNNLGLLYASLGKKPEALREHTTALELNRRLVRAHPGEPDYQLALITGHGNLATFLTDEGRPREARAHSETALRLASRLAEAHPGVRHHWALLADSRYNHGVLLMYGLGDRRGALGWFLKARDLRARLVNEHSGASDYLRRLAQSQLNLGVLLAQLGRAQDGAAECRRACEHYSRLADEYPSVSGYQDELALALTNHGVILRELNRPQEALGEYERSRAIRARLARDFPSRTGYRHSLAITHFNLGLLFQHEKKPAEAIDSFGEAIRLGATLGREDGQPGMTRDMLIDAHFHRAELLRGARRPGEALADYDRSIALASGARRDKSRLARADLLARLRDHARAAEDANALLAAPPPPLGQRYDLACVFALCAAAASSDAALPLPRRERVAEAHARQAVGLLRRLAAAGFFRPAQNRALFDKDDDLAALRRRADFRALVAALPPAAGE